MHRTVNVRALALAVCATLGTAAPFASAAAISFGGGTVTLTHDPDLPTTSDPKKVKSPSVVPSSANMPVPPSYHMNNTYVSGPGNTLAVGSFGHITNSSTAGFTMVAGSGLTQLGSGFTGSSQLRMDFDLTWNVNSTFAPATAFVSLPVAFAVGNNAGDFSRFVANITWDNDNGTTWRNYVEDTKFSTLGSSGVFVFNFNQPLGGGVLNAGTKIHMSGMIGFQANDAGESGMLPVNSEVGSAPPTFTFVPRVAGPNGTFDYSNPENWENNLRPGSGGQNAALHRARFLNQNAASPAGAPTIVNIGESEALNTLDIDSPNPYLFTGGPLRLANLNREAGGAALLNVRGVYGAANHVFNSGIIAVDNVELTVDSSSPIAFNGALSGDGSVRKLGLGGVALNAANTLTGDIFLNRGTLSANAPGSLGAGRTIVTAGLLTLNAPGTSTLPIEVNNPRGDETFGGGTIFLGVAPGPNDRFIIGQGGAVGAADGNLGVLTRANSQIAQGAIILHGAGGNSSEPQVVQEATTPSFIYGFIGEGANPDGIHIGSGSGGPWSGIGAGFGNSRVIGSLQFDGVADLVVSADGHMTLASGLSGGPAAVIRKTGQGVAVFEGSASGFVGTVQIANGGLLVNTNMDGAAEIIVESNGALGGSGKVAKVTFVNSGILTPGNSPGTLTTGALTLAPETELNFDLNKPGTTIGNDFVEVIGDLVLDGILNIFDGPDFGEGTYPLIHYTGQLIDNKLDIGLAPQFRYFNDFFAVGPEGFSPGELYLSYRIDIIESAAPGGGGTVFLNVSTAAVPEPGTTAALILAGSAALLREVRRRRSLRR